MAESFVNTFKRDYVSRMDLADARTVMAHAYSGERDRRFRSIVTGRHAC
jgi:hypothetical protein